MTISKIQKAWKGMSLCQKFHEVSQLPNEAERFVRSSSLLREIIQPEWLAEEYELKDKRWIAYGYMSPLECTQLFTRVYDEKVRHFYAKYYDSAGADGLRPVQLNFLMNEQRVMSQLWRARQTADRYGVPYDIFTHKAMEFMCKWKGRKVVPRPNQLYGPRNLNLFIVDCQEKAANEMLFREEWDERFFAHRFVGDSAQVAALNMMERRIRETKPWNRELALKSYLIDRRAITEAEARRRFCDELVNKVLSTDEMPEPASTTKAVASYKPPCLSLTFNASNPACMSCKFNVVCEKIKTRVDEELVRRHGDSNPRRVHRRKVDTERKRRWRANQRGRSETENATAMGK